MDQSKSENYELPAAAPKKNTGVLATIREWGDALIIAFVVAMFIRMFVVELFLIPSGSMTPTMFGDVVAEGTARDRNGESKEYLLVDLFQEGTVQVFEKEPDGHFRFINRVERALLTTSQQILLNSNRHLETHRILVNKFVYWFGEPQRGDVAIFRVPFGEEAGTYERNGVLHRIEPYNRNQATYVKRIAGLGGERVQITPEGTLIANGEPVTEPEIMTRLPYRDSTTRGQYDVTVPEDHVLMFGDNQDNSADSRMWGPLPERNLRGRGFLRFYNWPWKKFKLLNVN